jgi:hypothetical protein
MRKYPNLGRDIAISRMRSLSADWSRAVLFLYHAAPEKPASRQARRTSI